MSARSRSQAAPGSTRARAVTLALGLACVAVAAWRAAHLAWLTDDAYISFRYAAHLAQGMGLVYNPGERVEGYSNFLWTLWCAAGIRLGAPVETWAIDWGVAFHAATVAMLAWPAVHRSRASGRVAIPLAAIVACAHEDWSIFGTAGLETSLFVALAVATWVTLAVDPVTPRRAAVAALLAGLTALTRPDGVLFGAMAAGYVAWTGRPRWKATAAFAGVLLAIGVPYAAWKLAYFGDLLPNTYYAKSAGRNWFTQGFLYLALYFERYVVLLAGPPVVLAAWWRLGRRRVGPPLSPGVWLACAFAGAYLLYVARVGGDFMYARFALPATPFLLLALELGLDALVPGTVAQGALALALAAAVGLSHRPFTSEGWVHGIVDEHAHYTDPARARRRREDAEQLRRYFRGLPIRAAFDAGQLDLAYYGNPEVAIETSTGLTDPVIARQPLLERGRIGHEKRPPVEYLIDRRRIHFWMLWTAPLEDSLARYIPWVPIEFDSVRAVVLTWDPPVMAEMRRRGAVFPEFPDVLDEFVRRSPEMTDSLVALTYQRCRRFYFDHVDDPGREQPIRARLGLGPIRRRGAP